MCIRDSSDTDIRKLVEAIAKDLFAGAHVSLGFECPLFVPISDDPLQLSSARRGEGNRPWSAGAGSGSLAIGLTETVWILREIRCLIPNNVPAFLSWPFFLAADRGLFLWEAFVTKGAKGKSDKEDAEVAVRSFKASLPNPEKFNAVQETCVYSLIGAALLRTGWSNNLSLLETPCLVIKSLEP